MEQPTQVWSALVGLLVFTLTLPIVPDAHAGSSTIAPSARAKLLRADQVYDKFAHGQARVTVIVNLAPPARAAQPTDWNAAQSLQTLHAANQTTEDQVLGTLAAGEHKIRFRFHNQAGFSCEVTEKALDQLLNNPLVETVEPVRELEAHLAQGIPLMNALASRSTYNGTNMAIAICDTGIDYNHPRLGGGGFPNSKILGGYDFGDSDSDPIPNTQAHGTCCAGIAAGDLGTVGDYIGGVAPGAKLYALKISFGSTGSAYDDAMVAAWDWCVTHKNDNPAYPIMVISTSFGGGQLFSACDGDVPAMTTAANNAVAAGITVLASSGNDGFCDSIAWPACISNVISVGAVYDANFGTYQPCVSAVSCAPKTATIYCSTGYYATDSTAPDKVTSYSNVASFLDVFAPANQCYTLDITGSSGYDSGDYYAGFGGTSAACPYTAGAIACLQNAAKVLTGSYLTPAEVRSRLASSGNLITDTKVAITKPRVNLGNAIDSMSTALRVTPVTGLAASGPFGGPFSPSSQIYSLSNSTVSSLSWSASKGQTWVSVSAVSGTLTAGASTNVTVSINSIADGLGMGTYNDTVTFSNITAGTGQPRAVSLSIEPPHIYYFPLDTDPGWTKQGEWAFGHPTGQGGTVHGNPDPSNGATGTNVFGTNLSGDYSLSVGGPYYLTAGPLNFSGYTNTQLRFQRWLNTDFQPYVYATIDISTNGTTWTQIWSNGAAAEIADSSWASFQYDISALADNHAIVYIRWSYQVASAAFAYSGWNIDDIELLGTPMGSAALAVTPTNDLVSAGTEGGPFSPSSQIYALTNTGGASLNWAVSNSQSWVSLSATSGALAAGASTNITVSINAGANSLTAGSYSDTVTFTNATNGIGITNRSVSLTVNPPAPSTILADAGDLFAGTTNNLAPTNSVAVLVVDTGNNGFAPPQPAFPLNLGATWGADDQIVGLWDLTACNCGDGELFDETVVAYTNGVAPGQKLQLYWFPSLTLASNTLGVTYYGKYTDTNSPPLDGSDAWEIPAGGTNVHLIFWTPTWGGSNPQSAGLATLLTGGTSFAAWQQQYFGCTACPEAAEDADPDGDGQNNLAEFLAGTVPTNSASAFRVTAVARESNNLRVTWTMGSNKTNTLQAAAGAGNGSYSTNDFSDIFTVTNTIGWVTNYLDAGAATNFPSRFYRIRLVP